MNTYIYRRAWSPSYLRVKRRSKPFHTRVCHLYRDYRDADTQWPLQLWREKGVVRKIKRRYCLFSYARLAKKTAGRFIERERKKIRREKREKRILVKLHFFSKRTVKTKKKSKRKRRKGERRKLDCVAVIFLGTFLRGISLSRARKTWSIFYLRNLRLNKILRGERGREGGLQRDFKIHAQSRTTVRVMD